MFAFNSTNIQSRSVIHVVVRKDVKKLKMICKSLVLRGRKAYHFSKETKNAWISAPKGCKWLKRNLDYWNLVTIDIWKFQEQHSFVVISKLGVLGLLFWQILHVGMEWVFSLNFGGKTSKSISEIWKGNLPCSTTRPIPPRHRNKWTKTMSVSPTPNWIYLHVISINDKKATCDHKSDANRWQ